MIVIPEPWARAILMAAIAEERCADLLECLFAGGSVTIDAMTKKLTLVSADTLSGLAGADQHE